MDRVDAGLGAPPATVGVEHRTGATGIADDGAQPEGLTSRYAARREAQMRPSAQRSRRVKPIRRVKRTLRHVDPMTALKVSLLFYACFLILWLVLVAILYGILKGAGLFSFIEDLRSAFVVEGEWQITLWFVEKWAFLIGVTFAVLASLFNLFIAFLYNFTADVVGGIELTFVERDL